MRKLFTIALTLFLFQAYSQPLVYDFIQSTGGIVNADTRNDLVKDANGNMLLMGDFSGTRTFGGTSITAKGNTEIFIAKFSPSGSLIWVVNGGDSLSFANTGGVTVDAANNVYITGKYQGNFTMGGTTISTVANSDIFIAKINGNNGNVVWLKTAGGNSIDEAHSITHVGNNDVVITGAYAGSADFGSINLNSGVISNINIFVAKYNGSGVVQWAVDAGGSSEDKGLAVSANTNGDLYVAGYFQGNNTPVFGTNLNSSGSNDIFLAKLSLSNGSGIWARKAGGSGLDQANDISVNDMGDIFMTGIFYSTATFGSLNVTEASMAGDMFVVKYNNVGNALWVKKGGGNFQDKGNALSAEADGSVYVTGLFAGNSNFSGQTLSASGPTDAFMAKYNAFGTLTFVAKAGGSSNDQGKAICAGNAGNFCVAGSYSGTASFGSSTLTAAAGTWETFFACVDGGTVGVNETFKSVGLNLIPNPAVTSCNIRFDNMVKGKITVSIYTLEGKMVYEQEIKSLTIQNSILVDLKTIKTGMYIIQVNTNEYVANSKLIVQ